MAVQIGISRRRALEMTIAMGGLAMAGGAGHAQTPPTPKVEQLAPELEQIIAISEPIQHLADGFGGTLGPAEGPLWWKEGKYLLFSDIHNNKRMKQEPGKGVSVFLVESGLDDDDTQCHLGSCMASQETGPRCQPGGWLALGHFQIWQVGGKCPDFICWAECPEGGHEERFPSTRLSAGHGFGKQTIAGVRHNGRDAPISAVRATVIKPPQFDDLRMSLKAIDLYAQAHEDRPSLRVAACQ